MCHSQHVAAHVLYDKNFPVVRNPPWGMVVFAIVVNRRQKAHSVSRHDHGLLSAPHFGHPLT